MIYLGTDIVSIIRFEKIIYNHKNKFLNKIFTKYEQAYCNSKVYSYIHYSGKFAAKEAVKKVLLSSKIKESISLKLIEINNFSNGAPFVKIIDKNYNGDLINISISHTKEYATATAILDLK